MENLAKNVFLCLHQKRWSIVLFPGFLFFTSESGRDGGALFGSAKDGYSYYGQDFRSWFWNLDVEKTHMKTTHVKICF